MNVLEVKNVTRLFNDFVAVDNVSFNIKENQIVSVVGPNGAGKTTIIKVICNLLSPSSGEVIINSNTVGVVFGGDKGFYNNVSVYENLKFYANLKKIKNVHEEVDRVLDVVRLTDVKDKKVNDFSRGMKQRLHIARGMLGNPKLLILDEPTIGVDVEMVKEIQSTLKDLKNNGISILLTSHDLVEIEALSDHIILFGAGKIHFEGTLEEIKNHYNTTSLEAAYLQIAQELKR